MKGLVIHERGSLGTRDYGEPLYKCVGETLHGHMEIVRPAMLPKPYLMLVNEEGLLRGMEFNIIASILYGDVIVGPSIIMKEVMTDEGPDIGGLDHEDILDLLYYLDAMEDLQ